MFNEKANLKLFAFWKYFYGFFTSVCYFAKLFPLTSSHLRTINFCQKFDNMNTRVWTYNLVIGQKRIKIVYMEEDIQPTLLAKCLPTDADSKSTWTDSSSTSCSFSDDDVVSTPGTPPRSPSVRSRRFDSSPIPFTGFATQTTDTASHVSTPELIRRDVGPASPLQQFSLDDCESLVSTPELIRRDVGPASPLRQYSLDDVASVASTPEQIRREVGPASPLQQFSLDDCASLASPVVYNSNCSCIRLKQLGHKACLDHVARIRKANQKKAQKKATSWNWALLGLLMGCCHGASSLWSPNWPICIRVHVQRSCQWCYAYPLFQGIGACFSQSWTSRKVFLILCCLDLTLFWFKVTNFVFYSCCVYSSLVIRLQCRKCHIVQSDT